MGGEQQEASNRGAGHQLGKHGTRCGGAMTRPGLQSSQRLEEQREALEEGRADWTPAEAGHSPQESQLAWLPTDLQVCTSSAFAGSRIAEADHDFLKTAPHHSVAWLGLSILKCPG